MAAFEVTLQVDAAQFKELVTSFLRELSQTVLALPVVVGDDGSEWVDATDLRRLVEHWK